MDVLNRRIPARVADLDPSQFDAVFFDAGFTLVRPVRPVEEVYLEKAAAIGARFDEVAFRRRMREVWPRLNADYRSKTPDLRSSEELERQAWREFTFELARPFESLARVHEEWLAVLIDHFDDPEAWRPVDAAVEVVEELARRGFAVGVVTNWHTAVHGVLERHGIARHCRIVLTSAQAGRKKPHPDIFQQAAKAVSAPPDRSIHVGDSWDEDVLGARAAGMCAVHFQPAPDVRDPPPVESDVRVISRLRDLLEDP
jgi:putative hydrolase of the HAD superfamily